MPSAPMDITARAAAFSAYMNCGQICVSAERFFVHEKIHDEFVEKLIEETKKIRVGNGLDKVDMGPIVSSKERDRYENVLHKALCKTFSYRSLSFDETIGPISTLSRPLPTLIFFVSSINFSTNSS